MRRRIVIEVDAGNGITEGAARRMVEDIMRNVRPEFLRRHGVLPPSVKVKQYSRVVAAEYGAVPGDCLDTGLS